MKGLPRAGAAWLSTWASASHAVKARTSLLTLCHSKHPEHQHTHKSTYFETCTNWVQSARKSYCHSLSKWWSVNAHQAVRKETLRPNGGTCVSIRLLSSIFQWRTMGSDSRTRGWVLTADQHRGTDHSHSQGSLDWPTWINQPVPLEI